MSEAMSEPMSEAMAPQECQGPAPAAAAGQPAHDPAVVHVGAGDRILGAGAASMDAGPAADASPAGDPIGAIIAIGLRAIERVRDIVPRMRLLVPPAWALIAGAGALSFGLGFACAAIVTSHPAAPSLPDQSAAAVPAAPAALACEKPPARARRRLAKAPPEAAKPRLHALQASARAAQHAEPQTIIMEGMARISAQSPQAASAEQGPPAPPVPETKPTTIAGWSVREVNGETAVLAGPDHVFTARRGDAVPGVGRIDSIVRWGNRWIVATSKGLIATD